MTVSKGRGPTLVKEINRKLVYGMLKERRRSTRAELAAMLELNKNTVNVIVDELIAGGYITETGLLGRTGAGRKAVGIVFEPRNRLAIGMQLGASSVLGVITDLYANPLEYFEMPIRKHDLHNPQTIVARVREHSKELVKQYGANAIVGAGFGIPALLDAARVTVVGSSHLGWSDVPLLEMLRADSPISYIIDNNVKLASLGERWHGRAAGLRNFIYCSFGTGVGCSLIMNGEILRGAYGAAGELGHIVVEPNGPRCACGRCGCLEAVVGLPALYERLSAALGAAYENMTIQWLVLQAESNNEIVLEELSRAGRAIGYALSSAVNLLNPGLILFDGPLMKLSSFLLPFIEQELREKTIRFSGEKAELAVSDLYPYTGAIGAAAAMIGEWEQQSNALQGITF
ncbi:ROK family transcriptional regulator [Paenibacillus sp. HB172176]|uniref:ROK family transcriptional regulator n=1 Tax=Paenibacillus sp. HB172176 TaxID=2493690 RepID=UPI001438BB8A|nr:ROK family transcriptional regulator [Paenibacillus sp. HB172176]